MRHNSQLNENRRGPKMLEPLQNGNHHQNGHQNVTVTTTNGSEINGISC